MHSHKARGSHRKWTVTWWRRQRKWNLCCFPAGPSKVSPHISSQVRVSCLPFLHCALCMPPKGAWVLIAEGTVLLEWLAAFQGTRLPRNTMIMEISMKSRKSANQKKFLGKLPKCLVVTYLFLAMYLIDRAHAYPLHDPRDACHVTEVYDFRKNPPFRSNMKSKWPSKTS